MEDLKNLDQTKLVDMLAKLTTEYMKMFKNGTTQEEYENCKLLIARLTTEIEARNQLEPKETNSKPIGNFNQKE
ncbi:MAG TPA: hypothetical protein VFX58_10070 [Chitinophagaceae bacterium]|nr:hypothetical protein [Chitinophagaceae bacterium]